MKENLVLLSFSALLLASSSILSQPAGKTGSDISNNAENNVSDNLSSTFATSSATDEVTENSHLLIAKANTTDIESSDQLFSDKKNNSETRHVSDEQDSTLTNATPLEQLAEPVVTEPAANEPVANDQVNVKQVAEQPSDEQLAHLRHLFLQAEVTLKDNDDTNYLLLADQLKDYPLYPYLQYQWLKKHLDSETQIKQFLQQQSASSYADKLKNKWLLHLGKNKQWPLLLQNRIITRNATLNCYFHLAEFNTGDKAAALTGAQQLWAVGHSQPQACDPLFSQLQKSTLFTQDLRWKRFAAALKNNKVSLATHVKTLMPKSYQESAQLWLNLHRDPSRYIQPFLKQTHSTQSVLMFRHAIDRLARTDVKKAIEIWDANKQYFTLTKKSANNLSAKELVIDNLAVQKLERRLALKLVFEGESGAYERLGQLDKKDNDSRTWRVRIALAEQNWDNVLTAIQDLSNTEKTEERWQYWLARAYIETDEVEMAQPLLSELSKNRSFYGFLAADKVNNMYQLAENPINVTPEEIDALKNQREFRVAFEFMVLDRKNDAKLQWWHATRLLNKKEIIVAAKLAQRWQWDEIAIFTVAKAKHWDDIELRFPLSYADKILENSIKQKLNPAILFGLVRRESAFNEKAYSPVGARGLMQIMPSTGRSIAKNLNERWHGNDSLYNPVTNLKYGAFYYQKLLTQFDGNFAIALAAYNAGPQRVKKWLPETLAMPADIWIETIPYKETREYVTNVLAYALIYQQRAQLDGRSEDSSAENYLSMNDLTRDVLPLVPAP